jgi:hypothetical protein
MATVLCMALASCAGSGGYRTTKHGPEVTPRPLIDAHPQGAKGNGVPGFAHSPANGTAWVTDHAPARSLRFVQFASGAIDVIGGAGGS